MAELVEAAEAETTCGRERRIRSNRSFPLDALFSALSALMLAFIAIPLLRLALTTTPAAVVRTSADTGAVAAIWLSLQDAALTSIIAGLGGVPLGYTLARRRFPGRALALALADLPLAVPHTVAGIALLFVFGRRGWIGEPAQVIGLRFFGSQAGVIVAMLFVSAPFMINSARLAFESIDASLEEAARVDGASPLQTLRYVALPLAAPGIASGFALTYARSIAEFGAVVVLAYYPMTAPVKVYDLFLQGGLQQSAAAAVLLLVVTLATFLGLRAVAGARMAELLGSRP